MSVFNAYGRAVMAGVAGSCAFLYAKTGIPAPEMFMFSDWAISTGIGLLTTVGVQSALPTTRTLQDQLYNMSEVSGLSADEVAETVNGAKAQIKQIRETAKVISNQTVATRIGEIADVAYKIVDGFIDDPADIKRSRAFLVNYLDQTVELVERYAKLEQKDSNSDKVQEVMQKFETTLDEIEKAFEKQYERNLSDDVRGLDVDLKTLNTMLKEEGL
jgi:5-bromo-4-chloroindolyl phosphate hydrolysis protein